MEDYKLIPMNEITDEARKIAVAWMECDDKNWIGQKNKLASDIMNYAENYHKNKIAKRNKDLFGEDIPNIYFKAVTSKNDDGWLQCDCGNSGIDGNDHYVVTTHQLKADEVPEQMCDAKTASELIARLLNKYFNT
jgi:hypothetical protein